MHTDHGLVLRSFDYKEKSRIFTLFSRKEGIISLISRKALANLTTPLCYGEFLYYKGRGDLYSLKEGRILDMHLPLRASYDLLQVATKMLQSILDSQLPGKPTPELFDLLLAYLKQLPRNPDALYASFLLKLLKHEGLLFLSPDAKLLYELQSASSFDVLEKVTVQSHEIELAEGLYKKNCAGLCYEI